MRYKTNTIIVFLNEKNRLAFETGRDWFGPVTI